MEALVDWLQQLPAWSVYALLAGAAGLEYLFPPAPGDAFALAGVVLASQANAHPAWVYSALTAGSILGSVGVYALGRRLGPDPRSVPRWLGGRTTQRLLYRALDRFENHGSLYLALNRFLPSLRAVFFLAAGMKRLSLHQVLLWGGLSAAAWNGLLLGAGLAVSANLNQLTSLLRNYSLVVWGLLLLGGIGWFIRRQLNRNHPSP